MLKLVSAVTLIGSILGIDVPAHAGYLVVGIFIGIESMGVPMPGETALIAASIAAKQGDLDILWVIAAASAGAIIGDNIGYWIGRKGGRRLLEANGPFHERRMALLVHGDRFFAEHGPKAVFLGRWVALLRVTAAVLAGANRMDARKFFIWNAAGGIAWATSVGLVGYLLGATGEQLIHRFGIWAAVAGGLALVVILAAVSFRERRALKSEMAEVHRRETMGESMIDWDETKTARTEGEER